MPVYLRLASSMRRRCRRRHKSHEKKFLHNFNSAIVGRCLAFFLLQIDRKVKFSKLQWNFSQILLLFL